MTDDIKNKLKLLADAYHVYRETADRVQKEQRNIIENAVAQIRDIKVDEARKKIHSLLP